MGIVEIGLVVSSIIGVVTYCVIKTVHQCQNSKCQLIEGCGFRCVRDPNIDLEEPDLSTHPQTRTVSTQTRPTLDIPKSRVEELRSRFE